MPHETYFGLPVKTWIFIACALVAAFFYGGISAFVDHLRRRRALRRWQQETVDRGPGDHGRASRDARE